MLLDFGEMIDMGGIIVIKKTVENLINHGFQNFIFSVDRI